MGQQALNFSRMDEEEAEVLQKQVYDREMEELQLIFEQVDTSEDGFLSLDEFKEAFSQDSFKHKLKTLQLSKAELAKLFELLDTSDDGRHRLELEEFCEGMRKLQGPAKSMDMLRLAANIEKIQKLVETS